MEKEILKYIQPVINVLFTTGAHTATKFVKPNLVVKATRVLYSGKLVPKNQMQRIAITIGRPNVKQKQFAQMCVKAGEPFPVKNVQIEVIPVKRKKK